MISSRPQAAKAQRQARSAACSFASVICPVVKSLVLFPGTGYVGFTSFAQVITQCRQRLHTWQTHRKSCNVNQCKVLIKVFMISRVLKISPSCSSQTGDRATIREELDEALNALAGDAQPASWRSSRCTPALGLGKSCGNQLKTPPIKAKSAEN